MRRLALLMTVILLFILPSCGASDEFKGGRPITKEDLESVSASLFTTAGEPEDDQANEPPSIETTALPDTDTTAISDTESVTTTDTDTETETGPDTEAMTALDTETVTDPTETEATVTVYWLPSGTVYHLDRNCSHIADKENVNETSVQEAEENGRRLCKTCEKKYQTSKESEN